jgi:hypothetical protein
LHPTLFCLLFVFQVGSWVFARTSLDHDSYVRLPHSWNDRCTPPHPAYWLQRDLTNFFLGCPWTMILPISASRIAGITGVGHITQSVWSTFKHILWVTAFFISRSSFGFYSDNCISFCSQFFLFSALSITNEREVQKSPSWW